MCWGSGQVNASTRRVVPLEVEGGEAFANAEWRWRFGADEQICCGLRSGWNGLRLAQRRLDLDCACASGEAVRRK